MKTFMFRSKIGYYERSTSRGRVTLALEQASKIGEKTNNSTRASSNSLGSSNDRVKGSGVSWYLPKSVEGMK